MATGGTTLTSINDGTKLPGMESKQDVEVMDHKEEERHFWFTCMKLRHFNIISRLCGEFLGTAFLVYFGCMGLLTWFQPPNHLQMVLNFGFAIMIIIQIFAHISGSHFNPALSISSCILGNISVPMMVAYFCAQISGGLIGFGLLKVLTPDEVFYEHGLDGPGVCSNVLHPTVTPIQGLFIEFISTSVLILVCCSVWDPRNASRHDSVPIKFGFTIFVLAFTTGPYTGCSMNPARTLPPAVWNGYYEHHWIYWAGPILGGIVPTVLYKAIFWRNVPPQNH